MKKNDLFCYLLIFLMILPLAVQAQITNPILFGPEESDSLLTIECEFKELPALNTTVEMVVKVKALNSEFNNRTANYRPIKRNRVHLKEIGKQEGKYRTNKNSNWWITTGPSTYLQLQDKSDRLIKWLLPILPGDSLEFTIPLVINGVGKLDINVTERTQIMDPLIFHIAMIIDESGQLTYLGKNPPPTKTPLKAHPYLFDQNIRDHLIGAVSRSPRNGEVLLEPFDIKVFIEPNLQVEQNSRAEFVMTAMSPEIEEIQYEIVRAHNIKIDTIPPSQGGNPGIDSAFSTSFNVMPLAAGRSFLSFEVFGRLESGRGYQKAGSKVSYELIFDSDGQLLYLGSVDPFRVGFEPGNPTYTPIDKIMEFQAGQYGLKVERSEPDFVYRRVDDARILDSINAAQRLDSLKLLEQE